MSLDFLRFYAPVVLLVLSVTVLLKVSRHMLLIATRPSHNAPSSALDPPPRHSYWSALVRTLAGPFWHFQRRANPVWVTAVALYHVGIISTVAGYVLTMAILAGRMALGMAIPDLGAGGALGYDYSVANVVMVVFSNADEGVSTALFGRFAELFVTVTWVDVLAAFTGNVMMLSVRFFRLGGAVIRDLDPAARGVRVSGRCGSINALVSLTIFAIILTEIFARIDFFQGLAVWHSLLGLTLILLLPFSYLWHIFYIWVALFYAVGRRRRRAIA